MGRIVDQRLDQLPPELRERELYWRSVLAECEASELGTTSFARARGVASQSLFNWRAELARRDSVRSPEPEPEQEVSFLPVVVRPEPEAPSLGGGAPREQQLEVVLATGRRILVGGEFDGAVLARLVRLLEDLPC